MSDFLALAKLVLDPRPAAMANGGYACGAVGELIDGPAEVTLHLPPPLGVPLDVDFLPGGEIEVRHGAARVASARPVDGVDAEPPVWPAPDVTASGFLPDETIPNRNGDLMPDMVWAALDRASSTPPLWDRPSLLVRLAVERLECVRVGEPVVTLGWHLVSEGHKHHTAAALLSADGRVLARARALWITLQQSTLT